jgi:hypothetical protein
MKKYVLLAGLMLLVFSFETRAEILWAGSENIAFSPGKMTRGVTWSPIFSLTENGLASPALPANQSHDVWLQTHAFPIGLSWRPPGAANFRIYFDGTLNEENTWSKARLFIRYSCDKEHWSTWYETDRTEEKNKDGLPVYKGKIWLPEASRQRYNDLMFDWAGTKPIWASDENEFCEWLVKNEPDFFAKEFPFIGYVQVRLEKGSVNNQQVKSLTVEYSWAVGGLSPIPEDRSKVRKNTDDPWFFTAHKK